MKTESCGALRAIAIVCALIACLTGCAEDWSGEEMSGGGGAGNDGERNGSGGDWRATVTIQIPPTDPDGNEQVNGYPATVETADEQVCVPFAPTEPDHGGYARVVFGPFLEPWTSHLIHWLAARSDDHIVYGGWPMSLLTVPPGVDPDTVPCGPYSVAPDHIEMGATDIAPGVEAVMLETYPFLPIDFQPGETVVMCFRHDLDWKGFGQSLSLVMCGAPGSCTWRDRWETPQGEVKFLWDHVEADRCRHWMVELPPYDGVWPVAPQ